VEKDMPILDINDIRTIAVPVLIKTPTDKAIVFGSWARGTQTRHSDIDMVIISKKMQARFFDRYNDYNELIEVLGAVGLDLLIYSDREISDMKDRPFIKTILNEGVVIYER
jgi:predicted nucleotidyltransferase